MRLIIIVCLLLVFSLLSSTAGNMEMMEDRTEEMDNLNKQMVSQIQDLPKDGKVDAKARVNNESGRIVFDIYHVKTDVKKESLNFGGGRQKNGTGEVLMPDAAK